MISYSNLKKCETLFIEPGYPQKKPNKTELKTKQKRNNIPKKNKL